LGDQFGAFEQACHKPLPPVVRCNTLRCTPQEAFDALQDEGFELQPIPWCSYAARVTSGPLTTLGNTLAHFSGLIYLQEEVSLLPILSLAPQPGERLLDIAAAPGSKTTQVAQHMGDMGTIVANDISGERLKALSYHIERLGITSVTITHMDGRRFGRLIPNSFHRVVADCPCSGEGTVRKGSKTIHEPSPKARKHLTETQKALLVSAYKAAVPHGLILYSTCTLAPEENEQVLSHLLEHYNCTTAPIKLPGLIASSGITKWEGKSFHPGVAQSLRIYPHQNDTGGFFLALIKKGGIGAETDASTCVCGQKTAPLSGALSPSHGR